MIITYPYFFFPRIKKKNAFLGMDSIHFYDIHCFDGMVSLL